MVLLEGEGRVNRATMKYPYLACVLLASLMVVHTVKRQAKFRFPPEGTAGIDFPTYNAIPDGLSFTCNDRLAGYYADPETQCQVWHWCLPNGRRFSFLCPNSTVFNQLYRVCDWWYNVECASAPNHYDINNDLYKDKDGNPI